MQMPVWAPIADPEDSELAVRFDTAVDVVVAVVVPLALQLRPEAADVWATLLLSCHPMSAGWQAGSCKKPQALMQQGPCSWKTSMSEVVATFCTIQY